MILVSYDTFPDNSSVASQDHLKVKKEKQDFFLEWAKALLFNYTWVGSHPGNNETGFRTEFGAINMAPGQMRPGFSLDFDFNFFVSISSDYSYTGSGTWTDVFYEFLDFQNTSNPNYNIRIVAERMGLEMIYIDAEEPSARLVWIEMPNLKHLYHTPLIINFMLDPDIFGSRASTEINVMDFSNSVMGFWNQFLSRIQKAS